MLLAVGLGELDAGDLGDRVPLIGRLEGTTQQCIFGNRLGCVLGVDARGPEKHHLFDAGRERSVHDIRLDHQVVVEELRGVAVVGEDAANLCSGHENGLRSRLAHPGYDLILPRQIDDAALDGENLTLFASESTYEGRPDHTAMSRHPHALARQGVEPA